MKKIKLIFAIVFVISLLALISTSVSAENNSAVLSQTPFDVVQGETFTTTLYVEKGSNICSMKAVLNYDPEIVSLVSCVVSEDAIVDTTINDETDGQIVLTLASSRNLSAKLALVDITFKVNDFLADDTYDLLTLDESDSYFRRLNSNNIAENIDYTANLQKLHIYKYGDINLDGVVDGSDAVYILRYAAGLTSGSEGSDFYLPYYEDYDQYTDHQKFMLKIGDAYFDGSVTGQDSVSILRYAAGFSTEIMGSRVEIRFIDSTGALYARKTVPFGSSLTEIPSLPVVSGYDDGRWVIIDTYGNNITANFSSLETNITVYAVYDSYLSNAMQYYKDLLTTMYYSGDIQSGLSSDLPLTNSLVYQDDYTARVAWSSSNNAVLNALTGEFSKPTYESALTLTATITSYKGVKIESTDTVSFVYNVKGYFITPQKSAIAAWLREYFAYGIDYDLKLPTLIDNERIGSNSDYEVRVSWEEIPAEGSNIPVSTIRRNTSAQNIDLVATLTYNGLPLEDDGKVYIDNIRVSPITKDEVRASVIEQIAGKVNLTVTTNTELWSDEQIYGVNIAWTSNNTSVATIANNVITISDDAINGTSLPLTAHVSYAGDGHQYSFDLSYTISIANNNSLLVRGTNIDADLYDALKAAAGVTGSLTTESLKSPRFVYLDLRAYPDITSLRGITYCTNLRVLNISGLKIEDGINEVATLTKLQSFIARGCGLNNLSDGGVPVLKNMADLRLLDLSDNNFENLDSVLASNIKYGKLNEIYLSNNRLTDISGLNRAPALNILVLSGNGLESSDITQLAGYKFLTYLSLADNNITDISMLSGLKNLIELRLQNNHITNIKPLAGMVYLEALYLGHNNINVDIGFLNTLAKLRVLYVNDNNIDSISQLTMLSSLESINVSNNNIDSLDVLEHYKDKLKEIYAENNQIKSISFVSDMTNLIVLMLSNNPVFATSSSDFSNLSELRILTLSGIPLNDLSFLNGINGLIWLDVSNCGLRSYRILSETLCTDETTGESYYQVTNYVDNIAAIASQRKTMYYLDVSGNDFSHVTSGKVFSNGIPAEFNSLYVLNKIKVLYADNINYTINPGVLFAQMSSLEYVSIENDGLTDMSWLSELRYLVYVDLAGNSISKVDLGSYISMYSKGSLRYLFLDSNAESCEFKNAYYSYNENVLEELSLENCGLTDMSLLPDMDNIRYLNIADNPLNNLEGLVSSSHSIRRYTTVNTIDVSGLDADITPLEDIDSIKTVYAVALPNETIFCKTDLLSLYRMCNNDVTVYLYNKQAELKPLSSAEGAEILDQIPDFSCDIKVAADNIISDNNPFIIDEINDFDITWTLSNPVNYEIVDNYLRVKSYAGIEDEALTVTATITVYPDQATVSRDFTINTHILRASPEYYNKVMTGWSETLSRNAEFDYNVTLKAAETEGFSDPVKPVEDDINYAYAVTQGTSLYTKILMIEDGHHYEVKPEAPFNTTVSISVSFSHNNKNGSKVVDAEIAPIYVTVVSRTFTATFEMDEGEIRDSSGEPFTSHEFVEDSFIFENLEFSKPGYRFTGWDMYSVSETGEEEFVRPVASEENLQMPAYNIKLYAKWSALSYNVIFDSNGGSAVSPKVALSDVELGELTTPTKQYYTFDGWFTADGLLVTSSSKFARTDDLTLYAHWTLNSFIITFNATGGTVNPSSLRGYCGSPLGTLPTPTKDYHRFLGWYTEADGKGTKITPDTVIAIARDIPVYAYWVEKDPSGWTLASNVPSGAQIVQQEWRYTRTQNMESTNASESGWTQIGSRWEQTGTGSVKYATFPSGFDTGHSIYTSFAKSPPYEAFTNTDTKREVSNTHTGYIYYKWDYNAAYANRTDRAISSKKLNSGTGGYAFIYFYAHESTIDHPYLDTYYCNSQGVKCYDCRSEFNTKATAGASPRFCRFNYYTCTYTDYQMIYQYQKVTNETSSTEVSNGGEISNVQKYVRYREK